MADLNQVIEQLSKELQDATPEKRAEYALLLKDMPPETRKAMEVIAAGATVNRLPISFEGAKEYYFCKNGRTIPKHAIKWVRQILEAYEGESGTLIEGFRGSTKSTIAITMCEYLLGKNPSRSGLIVAATEEDANKIGRFMADTIELNAGWKVCFPNVVPDKERGWGSDGGYFIKNESVPYDEWVRLTMKDHQRDPSFLATSVTSGSVGKHPSLFLLTDDMHTGKNTASQTELETVKARFHSDVYPTLNRPKTDEDAHRPFYISTFTPWRENDTNQEMKKAGVYTHSITPILVFDENGDQEFEGQKCFLTWPEGYDIKKVEELKRTSITKAEFYREYMCDLIKAQKKTLKYTTYPHEKIDPRWTRGGGVDYASVMRQTRHVRADLSHFAFAIGAMTPMNTIVVVGGTVEQCTMPEGGEYIIEAQQKNINWRRTVVELQGGGKEFIQYIRLNPNIRAQERNVAGFGSKGDRLYNLFNQTLETGRITVSDANDKFLKIFRDFLDNFPDVSPHDPGWDVADAVFHMTGVFPECLQMPSLQRDQPVESYWQKRSSQNAWASLGNR